MQHTHCIALALVCSVLLPASLWAKPKTITVTIDSAPRAAMLYDHATGRYIGDTPYRLKVTIDTTVNCQDLPGLQVRWASGATASIEFLTVCHKAGGKQSYRFERPVEAPDLATDIQTAQYRQAQAEANSYALAAIILQAGQNFSTAYAAASVPVYRPSVTCLTIPGSIAIQTWCR